MTELTTEPLLEAGGREILLSVDTTGQKLLEWAEQNRERVEELLLQRGVLLIRGLKFPSSKQFGQVLAILFGEELMGYDYRSTPRTELRDNVYTATEYHPSEFIPQHNESSYANKWAMRAGFLCMLPSEVGGSTPLADSRAVYKKIPAEIREKFEARGVKYVRNYGDIDLPWTEVFQTTERDVVERFCAENDLRFAWKENGGLRTEQVNPAVAVHPVTGDKVWFNQAHLFHVSSLRPEVRESLLAVCGEAGLPRNAYYGDGEPLEEDVLQIIRDVYASETFHFDWRKNDLMVLDNMLFTHGRQPFSGDRKILVGMARGHGHK
ncbi:MAG TPA: TauD/TfdA family dioxygenase [Thermoanaerobaculia bacterium]|nr:TauD/TfdA family dioxygenase [Thermoanaerobaculia bacterium]